MIQYHRIAEKPVSEPSGNFPLRIHINVIRRALWSGNGASVMVGSGFSKNGVSSNLANPSIPCWGQLASELSLELYGTRPETPSFRGEITANSSSSFLELAQQYETSIGRPELHQFLVRQLRDQEFEPGEIHHRLLNLPWSDVFTTNWDTLLERPLDGHVTRKYETVENLGRIPLAKRPRVFKLHGSLPAQFPLIVTTEDYRTYPRLYAPFVNCVQQAMMETVFCLIGFSGDDPNFLEWSGWVRDNLGSNAPKIYLAGWFDYPIQKREMLRDRGVITIDLADHSKGHDWPENSRHHLATQWLIRALELGQPYDRTRWPTVIERESSVDEDLSPMSALPYEVPQSESTSLPTTPDPDRLQEVNQVVAIWRHNRRMYPGWLVFPSGEERQNFETSTEVWEPEILGTLDQLSTLDRLNAIHELIWRKEILQSPISTKLDHSADQVLNLIDSQRLRIDGAEDLTAPWAEINKACGQIALSLLSAARIALESELFEQRTRKLNEFVKDDLVVLHRATHDRCLRAAYEMDLVTLESLVSDWRVSGADPAWALRKSALMSTLGRETDAKSLRESAIAEIKRGDSTQVSVASREGWALMSLWDMENRHRTMERWRELTALKCNAHFEYFAIQEKLSAKPNRGTAPPFDLGRTLGPSYSPSSSFRELAAYRAIRMYEVTGVSSQLFMNLMQEAAISIVSHHPELAMRIVLLSCEHDAKKTLERVFSRTNVAGLPDESAADLADACIRLFEFALPRIAQSEEGGGGRPWALKLRVAVEALSRLVLRLTAHGVERVFDLGIGLYRESTVMREPLLCISVGNLLRRAWEALPIERRKKRAFDFLELPIAGMDGVPELHSLVKDPGDIVDAADLPDDLQTLVGGRWQEFVQHLTSGLVAGDKPRARACSRILKIAMAGQPFADSGKTIASAIWGEHFQSNQELPSTVAHYDWVFLLLPEPSYGLAESRFRAKWLTENSRNFSEPGLVEDTLNQVGFALTQLKAHDRDFGLDESEQAFLATLVNSWANAPMPQNYGHPFLQDHSEETRHARKAISGLASILLNVEVSDFGAGLIFEKVARLGSLRAPAFEMAAGLAKTQPARVAEVVNWLIAGLLSDDDFLARDAMSGIQLWTQVSAQGSIDLAAPPCQLLTIVGSMISACRVNALPRALQFAEWVFLNGTPNQINALRPSVLAGLSALFEILDYSDGPVETASLDRPILRFLCVRLAQAMKQSGPTDAVAVTNWLELADRDPLPEVRFAAIDRARD